MKSHRDTETQRRYRTNEPLCLCVSVAHSDERIVHQSSSMFIAHANLQNEPTVLWAISKPGQSSALRSAAPGPSMNKKFIHVHECSSMFIEHPKSQKRTHGTLGKIWDRKPRPPRIQKREGDTHGGCPLPVGRSVRRSW